jgi:hypothetical protein
MPFSTNERMRSETTTAATTLPPGRVGRGGGDVLDASNAHAGTGERAEGGLGTGAGGLGAVATSGPDLDVEGRDAELLAAGSCYGQYRSYEALRWGIRTDVLGRQHGSVWRGLVTVGLDLHATGDTGDGFAAGQIGDVDEGVVERRENAGNAEDELALRTVSVRSFGLERRQCAPRGPEVPAGCSPSHRARPSSWEA